MGGLVSGCGGGSNAAASKASFSASRAGRDGAVDCRGGVADETNSKPAAAPQRLTSLESKRSRERLDGSIASLSQAAEESGFTNLGMLVNLSALQIERASVLDGSD